MFCLSMRILHTLDLFSLLCHEKSLADSMVVC